ncbi:MAG TPA: DNA translocase FtsK [Dehalococcoidia bacterium]|nr:DNA translocase FtsK [Dehalococcoidia bacterium]
MSLKTKSKPTRRAGGHRSRARTGARRPSVRRRKSASRLKQFAQGQLGWVVFWIGVAGVLSFVFFNALNDGAEAIGRHLGVGVLLLLVALTIDLRVAISRPEVNKELLRNVAGWHLLGVFVYGATSLYSPGLSLGGVHFADSSLGGEFSKVFTRDGPGIVIWIATLGAGFSLIWPKRALQAWRAIAATAMWVWSLDLPQNLAKGIASLFTMLQPRDGEYEEHEDAATTYVPQLDEEWEETPALTEGVFEEEEEEEEPAPEPKSDVLVTSEPAEEKAARQRPLPMGRPAGRGWELPPIAALAEAADIEVRPIDNEARSQLIVDTLASFGVDARVVSVNQGPAVTQFGVEPGWEVKTRSVALKDERGKQMFDREGKPLTKTEIVSKTRVRVNRITALANDLALALAAPTIRIEAPVPGKPIVGIEVPNTTMSLVSLRSVVESSAFQKVNHKSKLALALGKGVSGEPVAADLAKMPHLLIAGSTGSGKSVCINSIISCFLLHNTPEELRLVLIDPKRVELTTYNRAPHLAFSKVIVDMEEVVGTLQAVIHEMDSRYRRFAEAGVRNIEAYNKSPHASHKLPFWVVIIDELADLMMAAPYEVERQICRLAQLARATGIHLIVATQRPSVDVITGLIKANFPTRIAFAVSSQVDSRTIIDGVGAEKLLGRGDMLFMATDAAKPKRIQGSYVSDEEIEKIVDWWANDRFRHLAPDKLDHLLEEAKGEQAEAEAKAEEDPLYEAARELAMEHSRISTSLLQRRLHIGYPRAARLIDMLEEEGVVSGAEAGQSRQVISADSSDDGYGGDGVSFDSFGDDGEDTARFE